MDGQTFARLYTDVITKFSRLDGLPIFLTHGASRLDGLPIFLTHDALLAREAR